jgi:6-phospho-beta-glucosidase
LRNIALIGGGGLRTPLLIHGLTQAQPTLQIDELRIYDIDASRAEIMARLGRQIVRNAGVALTITTRPTIAEAAENVEFVLSSLRVGGMAARARDERMAIEHGFAGQETTGPGGIAMALRTVPVTLEHARIIEQVAPDAWYINFTNPAGLITQALSQHTRLKVIGICDTPAELFHRVAAALGEPLENVFCDYAGLNHLGWVRRVMVGGRDVTQQLLENDKLLRGLYSADLFDPALIRALGLLPTEYLFFYYSQRKAYRNQLKAGSTRGAELERMNAGLFQEMQSQSSGAALTTYRNYLNQRNASYMKLEGEAGSAFSNEAEPDDPFEQATGYHRIAVDVMTGLLSDAPKQVVVNVRNNGAIEDLDEADIVEVPCAIDRSGPHATRTGRLPDSVRGLVLAVKAYERTAIRAALEKSSELAKLAMLEYPIIGQWEPAKELAHALEAAQPGLFGEARK